MRLPFLFLLINLIFLVSLFLKINKIVKESNK